MQLEAGAENERVEDYTVRSLTWAAMVRNSGLNWRNTLLRARRESFWRRLWVIAMQSRFIAVAKPAGSCGMRSRNPSVRISLVAFSNVSATSRSSTQSTGK